MIKLCSNADSRRNIEKLEFFITFDDVALGNLKGSCREYTLMNHLTWMEVIIKDVKMWRSWSNLWFVTKLLLGFVSWTETTNTELERQKDSCLKKLGTENWRQRCKNTDFNGVSCVCSLSWTKMDRRWTRNIQSRLFWSVKIHGQIVTTWWYGSSRRRWSSKISRCGRVVEVKVWHYLALVNSSLDKLLDQRREIEKKISVLLEPNSS